MLFTIPHYLKLTPTIALLNATTTKRTLSSDEIIQDFIAVPPFKNFEYEHETRAIHSQCEIGKSNSIHFLNFNAKLTAQLEEGAKTSFKREQLSRMFYSSLSTEHCHKPTTTLIFEIQKKIPIFSPG